MENLIPLLSIAGVGALFLLASLDQQRERQLDCLFPLRKRWGATITGRLQCEASFERSGVHFQVSVDVGEQLDVVTVMARVPGCATRWSVLPASRLQRVWRSLTRGVYTGNALFDRRLVVSAGDQAEASCSLTTEVQTAVLQMAGGFHRCTLSRGRLVLIASCPILEVVDLAVLMVERLRGLAAEMEFIEPRENSQGTCPVCGESPVDCRPDWPTDRTLPIDLCGLVSCRECGTPHHGDCWTYSGGCAVFACGGQHATSST